MRTNPARIHPGGLSKASSVSTTARFFYAVAGVAGLAIAISVFFLEPSEGVISSTKAVWLAVLLWLFCTAVFVADRPKSDFNLFSPLTFFLVLFSLFYALPALYSVWGKDTLYNQMVGLEANLTLIMAIVFLGAIAFVLTYRSCFAAGIGRKSRFFDIRADGRVTRRLWLVTFAVSWAARGYLFMRGHYLQIYHEQQASPIEVSIFAPLVFIAFFPICLAVDQYLGARDVGSLASRRYWRNLCVVNILAEYAWAIPTGSKGALVFPLLCILGAFGLRGVHFSLRRTILVGVALGGFYYLITPVTYIYREVAETMSIGTQRELNVSALVEAAQETAGRVAAEDPQTFRDEGRAKTMSRISYPMMLNEVIRYFQSGGKPMAGRTYYLALVAPIPRILWPGKPTISLGTEFSILFGFTATSSYAISQLGELYINFGIIGVVIGFAVFGILYRAFWNMAWEQCKRPGTLARPVYFILWMQLLVIGTGDNFAGTFGGTIRFVLVFYAILYFSGVQLAILGTPSRVKG